jgi:decaprenylphospho-beta-D-ribofuranose 2-oxidase
MVRTALSGWGRTAPSVAEVVEVADAREAVVAVVDPGPRGVLARGLGRSYGDAAQNGGGRVVRLGGEQTISLDPVTGWVRAGAGASIDDLLRRLVPAGWFVPVTPGTRQVTVGGAVAADIHGKNHHRDGSWGNHVRSLELLGGDGEVRTIGPTVDAELFWATVGGMGLTGVIMSCEFRAIPVETNRLLVDTRRCADLDATMAEMVGRDTDYRYAVAWLDALGTGRHLGRGVVTMGDHAPAGAVTHGDARSFRARPVASVPSILPSGLLNKVSVGLFNELWFRRAPRQRRDELQGIGQFFHPLDFVADWNRLYGRQGLLQYQFVVPFGEEATLRHALERLATAGAASFLTVLKRFGPGNAGYLSFPMSGWTLTLDIPTGVHGLGELLDELDRRVVGVGGRLYFAKDSRMGPALVPEMYPRLADWRAVVDRADRHGVFQSDLSRRLGLRARIPHLAEETTT